MNKMNSPNVFNLISETIGPFINYLWNAQ